MTQQTPDPLPDRLTTDSNFRSAGSARENGLLVNDQWDTHTISGTCWDIVPLGGSDRQQLTAVLA